MKSLGLNEIRERYLKFFENKGHLRQASASLVPQNDASLLLINAGMTPLKPYFTGQEIPPSTRMTTCQKCVRTADIERVGITSRHGTFFEMLGNFSFGDYFKKEAISWAWEFVTQDLELPEDKLWISVYHEDDESFNIWSEMGVKQIVRLGKEDNFWEHGLGPCGPCSEIYFDRGADKGCGKPDCAVGCDCDRFIEFWNLVFTQFDKDQDGNYNNLSKPNIDTGMGLERIASIMQGVDSLFEVDTVMDIMKQVMKLAGVEYGKSGKRDISLRLITDHIRSAVFMVCDNILPSNEGRGYVLRRLLRRAALHGKLLAIEGRFLADITGTVISLSKAAYPELEQKKDYIKKIINAEEEKFSATINQGLTILKESISKFIKKRIFPGDRAFELHDTYGFPLDLTIEILSEHGIKVDQNMFYEKMNIQKQTARTARKDSQSNAWASDGLDLKEYPATVFEGYEKQSANGKVLKVSDQGGSLIVLLDRTCFYGESGGQTGDVGEIRGNGYTLKVTDCKKTPDGKILHICQGDQVDIKEGDAVFTEIDYQKRIATARNHTTTHLLQQALKNVLGQHVAQSGSMVSAERLRFDFSHFQAMTEQEIERVEWEVNQNILKQLPVSAREMPLKEAKELGAAALFGEKYGEIVRVVEISDQIPYSIELCGGTHLSNTAGAGLFKILSESGVAAGTRRIEGVTGFEFLQYVKERFSFIDRLCGIFKTTPADLIQKSHGVIAQIKELEKIIQAFKNKMAGASVEQLANKAELVNGIKVIAEKVNGADSEVLRNLADNLRNKIVSGVVVLASELDGRANLIVATTKDLIKTGIHSGNIIKEIAKITGGGGGGRPDMAQAGGKDPSKINQALETAKKIISEI